MDQDDDNQLDESDSQDIENDAEEIVKKEINDLNEATGGAEVEYDHNKNVKNDKEIKRRRKIKIQKIKERVKKKREKAKALKTQAVAMSSETDNAKETDIKDKNEDVTESLPGIEPKTFDESVSVENKVQNEITAEYPVVTVIDQTIEATVNEEPNLFGKTAKTKDKLSKGKYGSNSVIKDKEMASTNLNEMTNSSSGIGTGVSEKIDANVETNSSVASSTNARNENPDKILSLCQRGDWIVLEQILRNTKKGHLLLSRQDQVGCNRFDVLIHMSSWLFAPTPARIEFKKHGVYYVCLRSMTLYIVKLRY